MGQAHSAPSKYCCADKDSSETKGQEKPPEAQAWLPGAEGCLRQLPMSEIWSSRPRPGEQGRVKRGTGENYFSGEQAPDQEARLPGRPRPTAGEGKTGGGGALGLTGAAGDRELPTRAPGHEGDAGGGGGGGARHGAQGTLGRR